MMPNLERNLVLAADDDPIWLEQIPVILEDRADVTGVTNIDEALAILEQRSFDVVLLDLNFADDPRSGLDVFRRIHAIGRDADVVVISGETHPERLIEVFNAGVTRFIPKPASPARIRSEIDAIMEKREIRRKALTQNTRAGRNPFLGTSHAIQVCHEQVQLALASGARDILLIGETGTGKEVLARYIGEQIDRSGRFLPINCSAISDGLIESELFGHVRGAFTGADRDRAGVFEAAAGGVVFLDELGDMPLKQQAKLLRVLQERRVQRVGTHSEREVSFRSVSATHVDLKAAVAEGHFREDLYFRVAQTEIRLPALRERREDIPVLIQLFISQHGSGPKKEIGTGAIELLQQYDWPGNVRQLEAVVRNLIYRTDGPSIREKEVCAVLPEVTAVRPGLIRRGASPYINSLLLVERRRFEEALERADGYRDEAARILGLSRATFFRRAKELGLIATKVRRSTFKAQ